MKGDMRGTFSYYLYSGTEQVLEAELIAGFNAAVPGQGASPKREKGHQAHRQSNGESTSLPLHNNRHPAPPPELGASLLDTWWHAHSDASYAQLIQCLNAYLDERAPNPNNVAQIHPPTESTKNALLQIMLYLRENPGYTVFIAKLGEYLDHVEALCGENGVNGDGHGHGNGVDQNMMAADGSCPFFQNGYVNGAPQLAQNGVGADATTAAGVKRAIVDVDGAPHAAEYAGQTKKERLG
ncbi:hypothetical protein N7510_011487 [Penicillium lagena]|uniref:uncharacterized protein n=1 Tax=Penicillium lagena TaxID=94218 RepID=UPI0025407DE1|nr:uncharacterized protein N7510_011487 [Penicillium lagena]KAJ5601953.1 hypothetical protein N7510_011487 [Penicillium lagena]